MQATHIHRSPVALGFIALLLVAVTAGAFMLTCVESVHAADAASSDAGTACELHEGHAGPDPVTIAVPDRSGASDVAVSVDAAPFPEASSVRVEAPGSLVAPVRPADPLRGRLLL